MGRPCENVNFCLFCECAFLHNAEVFDCLRDECVVSKTMVAWWEMSLQPRPLIVSNPPGGMEAINNIYLKEIDQEVILTTGG